MLKENLKLPSRYLVPMILKILAYNLQDGLLPKKWKIEHILPHKYKNSYFAKVSEEVIKEKIKHVGNKLPLEKKLNIQAGDGYFEKKKEKYSKSKIVLTNQMTHLKTTDWKLSNIDKRDAEIFSEISQTLELWNSEYDDFV